MSTILYIISRLPDGQTENIRSIQHYLSVYYGIWRWDFYSFFSADYINPVLFLKNSYICWKCIIKSKIRFELHFHTAWQADRKCSINAGRVGIFIVLSADCGILCWYFYSPFCRKCPLKYLHLLYQKIFKLQFIFDFKTARQTDRQKPFDQLRS